MSRRIVAHDNVHDVIAEYATEHGITKKEALRDLVKEAGYDV
jgi:hypothetical protein